MSLFKRAFSTLKPIRAALILQRNPITLPPLNEFEHEYKQYQENLKLEKSRGTFDLRTSINEVRKSTQPESSFQNDSKLNHMIEERSSAISAGELFFEPYKNDTQSLRRSLDRIIYLAVKDSLSEQWRLPSVNYEEELDEALHCTSLRSVKSLLDKSSEVYLVGRSPIAMHNWENWHEFCFRGQVLSGGIDKESFSSNQNQYTEFGWYTKEELEGKLDSAYFGSIRDCLQK